MKVVRVPYTKKQWDAVKAQRIHFKNHLKGRYVDGKMGGKNQGLWVWQIDQQRRNQKRKTALETVKALFGLGKFKDFLKA